MSDDYSKSYLAGLSGGPPPSGGHNQSAYQSGLFTHAENERQQREQQARIKAQNAKRASGVNSPATAASPANEPSAEDVKRFSFGVVVLITLPLILASLAVSIATAVLAVFMGFALWGIAKTSNIEHRLTYGESYMAAFVSTTVYVGTAGLLMLAFYLYRRFAPGDAATAPWWGRPGVWNVWVVAGVAQVPALLVGAGGLKWRERRRYAKFAGYVRAGIDMAMMLVVGAVLAAAVLYPLDYLIVYLTGGFK